MITKETIESIADEIADAMQARKETSDNARKVELSERIRDFITAYNLLKKHMVNV